MAQVAEEHGGPKPESLSRARSSGQYRQRLKIVVVGDVIDGPHRVAAHRFAFFSEVDDVFRFGKRRGVNPRKSDVSHLDLVFFIEESGSSQRWLSLFLQ